MASRFASLGSQPETAEAVRRALEGREVDWRSRIWEAFLILSLIISFFFLVWLLLDILVGSLPGLAGARRRRFPHHAAVLAPGEGRHRPRGSSARSS